MWLSHRASDISQKQRHKDEKAVFLVYLYIYQIYLYIIRCDYNEPFSNSDLFLIFVSRKFFQKYLTPLKDPASTHVIENVLVDDIFFQVIWSPPTHNTNWIFVRRRNRNSRHIALSNKLTDTARVRFSLQNKEVAAEFFCSQDEVLA